MPHVFHPLLSRNGLCGANQAAAQNEFLIKYPLLYKFLKNGCYHIGKRQKKLQTCETDTLYKPAVICEMEEVEMCEHIIETKNVSKKFKRTHAIKDLSMSVRKNSVYGLLGPNGAGKSTLLKMNYGNYQTDFGRNIVQQSPLDSEKIY